MEKPKFTPGPWFFDGPPDNHIVWSSGENRVCFMAHSNGIDPARDTATASLIAAAPDLYAAARLALNYIENTEAELAIQLSSGDALRAALSKANGESGDV